MAKNAEKAATSVDEEVVGKIGEEIDQDLLANASSESFLNFEEEIGEEVKSKLRVKPRPELNNLTIMVLEEVSLKMVSVSATDKNGLASQFEYAGCEIPSLRLSFRQLPTNIDPYDRFLDIYISPYAYKKNDNTLMPVSTMKQHYKWEYMKLRHIADAYKGLPNYEAVKLPAFDPCAELNARLKQLKAYYEAFVKFLNGKDGKGFPAVKVWVKIVADSVGGTYYTLPDFVNDGFIERVVEGKAPSIEVKPNDVITLVASKKAAKGSAKGGSDSAQAGAAGLPTDAQVDDDVMNLVNKYQGK